MDWPLAIRKNRQALQKIIAALIALAGWTSPGLSCRSLGESEGRQVSLPRHILAAILVVLRPAESAVRRLILLVARCGKSGSVCESRRVADVGLAARLQAWGKLCPSFRAPTFALFDTLKSFAADEVWNVDPAARIRFRSGFDTDLDPASGFRALADSQEPIPAAHILHRLAAISRALDNLPRQARRLVRWRARRNAALTGPFKPMRITQFRPGLLPGWRQRPVHEIDHVLRECHRLSMDRMNAPDTG